MTTRGGTPCARSSDAHVWRRSWNRIRRTPARGDQHIKQARQVPRLDHRSDPGRKRETGVGPPRATSQLLGHLPSPMSPQDLHRRRWKRDRSPRPGRLRRSEHQALRKPLHVAAHVNQTILQINVLPSQGQQLALSQTQRDPDGEQRVQAMRRRSGQKHARLLWRPRLVPRRDESQVHGPGRRRFDRSVPHASPPRASSAACRG